MRRVIIIGATSGIGQELAKLYIANGDMVGATGRREQHLLQLQDQFSDQVKIECFDVTGHENILHLQSLIGKLGGMDILVYNSGFGEVSKTLDWKIDEQTTKTNVNGFVEIVNYGFNYFAEQGHGQIAAISSIGSIRGNSWAPAYSASKAFMSVYMEGLHIKSKKMKLDIAITDILPGFVDTKMARSEKIFWLIKVEKAANQIFDSIQKKKRKTYVSKRWWLIAWILKWLPYSIYKRMA